MTGDRRKEIAARRFWKYQVRYRLARRLIHMALFVLPHGRYKAELLEKLWDYTMTLRQPRMESANAF